MKQRLLEAGLVKHWMDDLIATASRAARALSSSRAALPTTPSEEAGSGGLVVLGVEQLQGAFYLLFLGALLGFLLLVGETLMMAASKFPRWSRPHTVLKSSSSSPF
ncbi:hypothetical protein E2C01_016494 [Portunus trituberculatus]|uniref:Uncharacterized protein n=1 Tax=Portunus trituberculatus TaxID=210409 RepID=A0A5B7DQE7_PORTR|nr:hypothetical protein [Portunus trituberculatus]